MASTDESYPGNLLGLVYSQPFMFFLPLINSFDPGIFNPMLVNNRPAASAQKSMLFCAESERTSVFQVFKYMGSHFKNFQKKMERAQKSDK